jgi:PAS domain S-box-containing protein
MATQRQHIRGKSIARRPVASALPPGDVRIGSNEARLRRMATIIQDSNDAITIQDLEGRILAWNRGAELIYGYSESEALRMNIIDTVPESHRSESREFIAALKGGKLVPVLETKRRTKDGRIIDVWLTNTKLVDDQGNLTGVATTGRDITEQTRTLEKFRRMATVIKDSNDAITFQDLEGNILAWNKAAEKIYGYSETEALDMNIVDTVPTEYQEEAREFLSSLKRGELVPTLETKRKHKDGRIIDVWLTNTKLTDEKGKLTGIATTERDITERKDAEASLRDKARELEFLRDGQITLSDKMRGEQDIARLGQSVLSHLAPFLNAQMGAFYCLTEEKNLLRVSGYAYSRIEAKEKTIALGEGLVGQAALEGRPIYLEKVPPQYFGTIRSDLGEAAPRSLLLAPVFYDGEVNGVIELASFSPFSEHQRAFLAHVSENIGIAINTSNSRKRQQDTNAQLEKQTQALEQQRDILNEKNEALNKAQALLEERSAEVHRASQYKSEFLANMSHELRTPLNSSLILAKLLAENASQNLTEEQVQYANTIYSAGHDLLNLINDILDLSKVEAGKLELRLEQVRLSEVLASLEMTFRPLAGEKMLTFQITAGTHVPETMLTDRQRLEQILKNLMSNAFKFTERGKVTLHLSRLPDERLSFAVIDTGIGVEESQQQVIFEAFRQADGTSNRKYVGTGLGLSISRDLARLLGGSVEVTSSSGEGSRFTLLLPETYDGSHIADAPPKTYTSPPRPEEPVKTPIVARKASAVPVDDDDDDEIKGGCTGSFKGRTILIVDDDVRNIFALKAALEPTGAQIEVARNGKDALEKLEAEPRMDLVLMDVMMPGMDGYEATREIRKQKRFKNLPVIAVTAKATKVDQDLCMEAGADDYLAKPIDLPQLYSLMRVWMPKTGRAA